MGHLRGRNEATDGLSGSLDKQREQWWRSYGGNHPTVWSSCHFQPGHTRVKEQATLDFGDAKAWKASLAHPRATPIFLWTHPIGCRQQRGFVSKWLFSLCLQAKGANV